MFGLEVARAFIDDRLVAFKESFEIHLEYLEDVFSQKVGVDLKLMQSKMISATMN
jgi:hypothetical protein